MALIFFSLSACQPNVRFAQKKDPPERSSRSVKGHHPHVNYSHTSQAGSALQYAVINEAEEWLGVPYCYGGSTKECTDCSGFVMEVFKAVGIVLPRTAAEQCAYADRLGREQLEPGDLVFFGSGAEISHVGIYTGNGMMIHASSSLGVVRQSLDDDYYTRRFAGGGRVIARSG